MRDALTSVPGVRTAAVDFAKKEADVTVEKAKLDTKALVEAVNKLGYTATVKTAPSP